MNNKRVAPPVALAGAIYKKSSRGTTIGNCVEVADLEGHRAVRDSKGPSGPALTFTAVEWAAFTAGVAPASSTEQRHQWPP